MQRLLRLFLRFREWFVAQMQSMAAIKRPDPVEIVAISIPLLAEAVAVVFAIAVAVLICGIRSGAI